MTRSPEIIKSKFIQIHNILDEHDIEWLLQLVEGKEKQFIPTTNAANNPDYRKSKFISSFEPFESIFKQIIWQYTNIITKEWSLSPINIDYVEAQLTAHGDGGYYKIHNDNGSLDAATRALTYVYYFNKQPKAFTGGELLLYDLKLENNFYGAADTFTLIEPIHNSLIFFPSSCMHEVLPVKSSSKAFMDNRFTINGWIREKTHGN